MKIKTVHFDGSSVFKENRLHRVMISRPTGFLSKSYYYPEVFKDDLRALELFYRQNGYLEFMINSFDVRTDTSANEVYISISVEEGELTRIEGVSILGNIVFNDELLFQKINIPVGAPFLSSEIENSIKSLLTFYADNGFLDAEVQPDIRINSETHRALVDFIIAEKSQYTINDINITGLEKTKPNVVMRELKFRPGEIVNYSRLLESQRRVYLTGLFQSVFIRPQAAADGDSTKKDILIELRENLSIELNTSVGYGTIEKARGKFEIFNTNLNGTARKIGLIFKISFINRGVEASFTEPWTFGIPLRTDINLSTEFNEEPGYNINRTGGQITFGRQFQNRSNLTVTYRQERAKLSKIKVREIPESDIANISSLRISIIYDTRDNLFNATKGKYFEWSNDIGGTFTNKLQGFFRSACKIKYFYPWNRSTVIASSLELGWMNAQGGLKKIPLQERFYAGGPNSLRGFGYKMVGPLDINRIPTGGSLKLVWNLIEIRRTLYKMIGGVVFADIGNVWQVPKYFKFNGLRSVFGLGIRFNTPVGLVRLDYGINVDKRVNEDSGKLYFSIGHAF